MEFPCGPDRRLLRPDRLLRARRQDRMLRLGADRRRLRLSMSAVTVEDLWREMHAPLLRLIGRSVSDPGDAEDVLQDVMVRIQRHSDEMDEFENLSAWVHQVTRSAVIDFYRRRAARPERPTGTTPDLTPTPASTPPDVRTELARCLRPLLARLPDKYREALALTEFEGLSQTAAAERLGLSTSGMKARVQRARAQLRELLLECCHVELDRRGGVSDYQSRPGACDGCNGSV
jgi:RNA polymerase sigma-70 factor (ECF subfamily)